MVRDEELEKVEHRSTKSHVSEFERTLSFESLSEWSLMRRWILRLISLLTLLAFLDSFALLNIDIVNPGTNTRGCTCHSNVPSEAPGVHALTTSLDDGGFVILAG
jgi:hypothetical protein